MHGDESIMDAAIDWHLRQGEMLQGDWERFVAWLEASPTHARAYDAVAAQDRLIGDARFPVHAANDDEGIQVRRWPWAAGGLAAAAMLAAVIAPLVLTGEATTYAVATGAGEHKTVTLSDGTSIALNGDTRIRLDRNAPRRAVLERGEAMLRVTHDAADPFTVTAGGLTIRDAGTVFDLIHDGQKVSVAVGEGSVVFDPDGAAVTLRPGDALSIRRDSRQITRSRIAPETVGGWRTGTLSFNGAPLAAVADALRRQSGTKVVLAGDLSARPFTGMIHLTGSAERDVPHLASLIGAHSRRDGERWILESTPAPQ